MKIKELKDLRQKDTGYLEHELREKQRHLFDLRSQAVTEKLENPSRLQSTRRDIARLKTLLRQRQLERRTPASGGGEAPASVATST